MPILLQTQAMVHVCRDVSDLYCSCSEVFCRNYACCTVCSNFAGYSRFSCLVCFSHTSMTFFLLSLQQTYITLRVFSACNGTTWTKYKFSNIYLHCEYFLFLPLVAQSMHRCWTLLLPSKK